MKHLQGFILKHMARIFRSGILLLTLGTMTSASQAVTEYHDVTISHGYAVFGELKYGPDFDHLEYTKPDAPKGGVFRNSGGQSFDSVNQFSILGNFAWLTLYLFDPLMERSMDEPASYYGVIAKTITYPKDYSWVEFELRPEARWFDGKPITVEDVIFTVQLMKGDLVNPRYGAVARVTNKVYQVAPNKVRFELSQINNPTLPATVAGMKVLPKHYYKNRDLGRPSLDVPVTSGPYTIGEVAPGRVFELVRDKNYWGEDLPMRRGRYNFDKIRHIFFRDSGMQQQAFNTGVIDFSSETNAQRWKAQRRLPAYMSGDLVQGNVAYSSGAYYNSMVINSRKPFLSDRRVRHAIQLAYDFEFVRDTLLYAAHERTESYFSNMDFEAQGLPTPEELELLAPYRDSLPLDVFTSDLTLPKGGTWANQRKNLKRARDLLAEAGYRIENKKLVDPKTGEPVRLELLALSPIYMMHGGYFIKNMERLGIEVTFRNYDVAQFRYLTGNRQFDLMIDLPVFPTSDMPGPELRSTWSSTGAMTPNTLNYAGVREPVIDEIIEKVIGARDRKTVVNGMRAIDRILRNNYYSIPLQHTYPAQVGEFPITYWNRFGRPQKDPTYNFPVKAPDHWWWDPKKEAKLSHGVFN